MIQEITQILANKTDLSANQMEIAMEEIMSGRADTADIVSFLTSLNKKGQTLQELTAAVAVMRKYVTKINTDASNVLDTCGTGGDNKNTFNVSTVTAFVASGVGITVAKHGNRSVSSLCGSADILEALGVNINLTKEKIETCLSDIGIAFLFAQNLHPAMKYAMPARKQIAQRTIFNILGPLTNPAGASHQLVGVYDLGLTKLLAAVLGNLGSKHALVVYGEDGLDEITTTGKTFIAESAHGKLNSYEVIPEDFGLKRARIEDFKGGSITDNAVIVMDILKGRVGPRRDIVILNAAAAIYAADRSKSIKEAMPLACESIDSGSALKKLELLKEYSNEAQTYGTK